MKQLAQLSSLGAIVPRMTDPLIGVAGGMALAYWLTRKEQEKWGPFWMTFVGAFVALRASALIDQQAQAQVAPPSGG